MTAPGDAGLSGVTAVILAGGLGTRLRLAVPDRPKVLAPVGGEPFLKHMLDWLAGFSCTDVMLCLGHRADQVMDALDACTPAGMSVGASIENEPLGTLGALRLAELKLGREDVLVMNGDSWTDADLGAFRTAFNAATQDIAMLSVSVENAGRFGRLNIAVDGTLAGFTEKTPDDDGPGPINAGLYLLGADALRRVVAMPGSSIERDVFAVLEPGAVRVVPAPNAQFVDIGTPESLALAERLAS